MASPAEPEPVDVASTPRGAGPPPRLILAAVAVVIGAVFAAPLGYLTIRSLTLGPDLPELLTSRTVLEPLVRTLNLAVAVAVSTAALGTATAWLAVRTDVPLGRLWRILLPLPLVIPSFVGAASLLAAFAPGGLLDEVALEPLGLGRLPRPTGFWGAFVVLTLLTYPYVYLPVAARLRSLPPSLEESARLLGRRPWRVFWTVVMPQARFAVSAGALLVFLYTVSDFGAVQLLRYDTLTRVIYANRLNPPVALPLSLALGLLAVVVVAVERGVLRRGPVVEAVGAGRPLRTVLGRWKAAATAIVGGTVVFSLLAPVTVLAWWAVRGVVQGQGAALATDVGELVAPAVNTSVISVVTAVVTVAAVLPVAYLTRKRRSRLAEAPGLAVVGGFALPGLVIALALVFWALQLPGVVGLYQTMPLLVLAYVVHFGAQALRPAQVAVGGVPARLEDAARMLGAGRARRFVTVELPLMLPGLLAGAGLVLLSTMKELPATLLLAPIGFDTIALRIWNATEDGFLAEAGLASLLLIALSGVLTWMLVIRRGESIG